MYTQVYVIRQETADSLSLERGKRARTIGRRGGFLSTRVRRARREGR